MNSLEKNLRPVPRTLDEAQRNATYAIAIQTFKSDAQEAWEFLIDAVYGFVVIGAPIIGAMSLVYWLIGR